MFTTPCYIRKNTPELREALKELGYKLNNGKWMGKYLATFLLAETNEWKFVGTPEYDLTNHPNINNAIDCGENEELFLSIAALRDDTDRYQWFVVDESEDDPMPPGMFFKYIAFENRVPEPFNYHKASVEEIIEYYKEN